MQSSVAPVQVCGHLRLFRPAASVNTPDASWGLLRFVQDWLVPDMSSPNRRLRRKPAAVKTRLRLLDTAHLWAWATGDPPLCQLSEDLIDAFVDALPTVIWRRSAAGVVYQIADELPAGWHRFSAWTICNTVKRLGSILRATGPTIGRVRGAGIVAVPLTVPGTDPVDTPPKDPWTVAELRGIARGCELMRWRKPAVPVAATDWWRAFLALSFYTGLRLATLLNVRWENLTDRYGQPWLHVRQGKTSKIKWIRCHSRVVECLDRLRPCVVDPTARVLPQIYRDPQIGKSWRTLLRAAQVAPTRRFSVHVMRATHDTEIAKLGAGLAQEAARAASDHSSAAITAAFYADADNLLRPSLPDLWPQGLPPRLF